MAAHASVREVLSFRRTNEARLEESAFLLKVDSEQDLGSEVLRDEV